MTFKYCLFVQCSPSFATARDVQMIFLTSTCLWYHPHSLRS